MSKLNERKQNILQAIIQDYLTTAEPVGSRHISRKYRLGISPATIRNEMADLEEEGYIKQPYTSAGRVPSDKGYRYYVDNLMKERHLTQREELLIKDAYKEKLRDIEFVVHQTLATVSSLTHYAAIMMMKSEDEDRVYHYGISNIVSQPEFSDATHLKQILRIFEEEKLLSSILHDYSADEGITIKIGSENKYKEIKDCSVIVTSYRKKEKGLASIGIIGLTRMLYNKATTVIDFMARELSYFFAQTKIGGS